MEINSSNVAVDSNNSSEPDSASSKSLQTANSELNHQKNLSSTNKPMSPPVETVCAPLKTTATLSKSTLKELFKQSKKMNAKIMPNIKNVNCAESVDGIMNLTVCLSSSDNQATLDNHLNSDQANSRLNHHDTLLNNLHHHNKKVKSCDEISSNENPAKKKNDRRDAYKEGDKIFKKYLKDVKSESVDSENSTTSHSDQKLIKDLQLDQDPNDKLTKQLIKQPIRLSTGILDHSETLASQSTFDSSSRSSTQKSVQSPDHLLKQQPILKPILHHQEQRFIDDQSTNQSEDRLQLPPPQSYTKPNELDLNLKSTLHHALGSKYAYLSFQDSFNIRDYQSFDSNANSAKNSNRPASIEKQDTYNQISFDASFSTSFDGFEIVNKTPLSASNANKNFDSAQKLARAKSNRSLQSDENPVTKVEKEVITVEDNDVECNDKDNYLYNSPPMKRRFQFKRFANAIRLIKNWATSEDDKTIEEPMEDFNFKVLAKPLDDEKQAEFLCFGNLVIDSNKPAYYYWLIVISFATLYNLLMIVGRSTFWELQNKWTTSWIFLDYFCDFIYLVDIVINARTAYLEDGLLVRDAKKLWANYYHSLSFKLDILSSLPTDFYFFYTGLYCEQIPCSVIIRLNRLLKIYRLSECFEKIETRTNYPNAFRISKMIFIILVVIHWNGCLYFYVSSLIGFSIDKWTFNLTANPFFSDQYIYCFYWSTLTLTAIGEVPPPTSDVEYLFVTFNFLVGVLIFAAIVGNVGSMITNMNQSRAEFQAKMDAIKQYMEFRRISKTLENRVIKWFDYLWQNKQSLDEESVLNVLPDKLKTEIAIHVHLGTLKKVKLFQGVDNRLLEQLVLKLRLQVFSPGDYICRKGDVGKEMYIVKKGRLSVVSEDGQTVFANLSDGAVFGELSVLNIQGNKTGNRRSANVRSVGYSDLFCLYKQDLMQVLEEYPEAKEMLIERGKEILRKDGLLDEDKLRAEEQTKENLMARLEQITNKYEHMTKKFARFIAEYSVSQRKMKQRIYQLEKNLENNRLNSMIPNQEANEEVALRVNSVNESSREKCDQEIS